MDSGKRASEQTVLLKTWAVVAPSQAVGEGGICAEGHQSRTAFCPVNFIDIND